MDRFKLNVFLAFFVTALYYLLHPMLKQDELDRLESNTSDMPDWLVKRRIIDDEPEKLMVDIKKLLMVIWERCGGCGIAN